MSDKKREVHQFREGLWHPTIDYTRCTSCESCFHFCFKGVYTREYIREEGRVEVTHPDRCVDRCHGCEWRCPAEAISFPVPMPKSFAQKQYRYLLKKEANPDKLIRFLRNQEIMSENEIEAMQSFPSEDQNN